jgi:hypothetical protein
MTQQIIYIQLVNILLQDRTYESLIMRKLDSYGIRKIISRIDPNKSSQLYQLMLDFQKILMIDYSYGLQTKVSISIKGHSEAISQLWSLFEIKTYDESSKWRQIGFLSENPDEEIAGIGLLGLATIHFYVKKHALQCQQLLDKAKHSFDEPPMMAFLLITCKAVLDFWKFDCSFR